MNRVGGLDLCDVCLSGHLVPRMRERWGWNLSCEQYEVSNRHNGVETSNEFVSDVRLSMSHRAPLNISCRKRRWYHLLFDLLGKTSKIGDPLFDRHVVVMGGPQAIVSMLLESDGAQSAVMNFALGGYFDINGQGIEARRISEDALGTEGEVMAEVCAIALRLQDLL